MPRFTQAQLEDDEGKLFAYSEEHFKMAALIDISRLVLDKTFKRQMSNRHNCLTMITDLQSSVYEIWNSMDFELTRIYRCPTAPHSLSYLYWR
ncbi:uncharacterized protein N7529_007076 [Penicillium soppii]|uniref:uncharacterized protein n=1 Tax=Penicillium soppii TaxID=69789 RepID=UPI002546E855|nr:uncharacterized protein N7529_007076 [Penicillium soppii]KAJ5865160.1 hypothetical protein N7529_007076 [Penicillium soppii]